MIMSQLLVSHTQLEAARRDRDLSKLLKGVRTQSKLFIQGFLLSGESLFHVSCVLQRERG